MILKTRSRRSVNWKKRTLIEVRVGLDLIFGNG